MDLTPPPSSGAFVNVDEEYEDVEVGEFFDSINESIKRIPDYENLQDHQTKLTQNHRHQQQEMNQKHYRNVEEIDAMLFSVGLRFPSIRMKSENKKISKKNTGSNVISFFLNYLTCR